MTVVIATDGLGCMAFSPFTPVTFLLARFIKSMFYYSYPGYKRQWKPDLNTFVSYTHTRTQRATEVKKLGGTL